ncbi:DNA topoisomerase IB [Aureimonas mangrovi]|uniref:DNA topoisomerase IB n=1 Tax=Aureimonas mangrovi TaxID=2758041 RepID=UPI00163D4D9C|nr:DNA topoisomerase IB [Aureimonas mangrovi]
MSGKLEAHAERLGLVMVDPSTFEIERHRSGKGHRVCFANGEKITDKVLKARIKALVLPPAWSEVRICVEENGHIQATGRDEKGRLQYRYHDLWVNVRNAVKTERLLRFGRTLPKLRKRIDRDLRRDRADRTMTAATAARLIDVEALRPGHEKYAADGGRGVASLQKKNLRITNKVATLSFVGKSNKAHRIEVRDKRLIRSLQKVRQGAGKRLFRFDGGGKKGRILTANLLNDYLHQAGNPKISAKDFRTFHGSAEALRFLIEDTNGKTDTASKRKRAVASAMRSVAELLRNTPAVARSSYVHPEIVTAFEEERLDRNLLTGRAREGLTKVESGLMRFLEETAAH